MKKPAAVALPASLLLYNLTVVTSSASLTYANTVTVTRDDATFEIARYRHGRSGVSFEHENDGDTSSCEFIFNKAGFVATIAAGSEEYKVIYDSNGDVEDVERRDDFETRALTGRGNDAENVPKNSAKMPSDGENVPKNSARMPQGHARALTRQGNDTKNVPKNGARMPQGHPQALTGQGNNAENFRKNGSTMPQGHARALTGQSNDSENVPNNSARMPQGHARALTREGNHAENVPQNGARMPQDYGTRSLRLSNGQNPFVEGVLEDIAVLERREAVTCEDCEAAWETVCGDGLESLCDLQEQGFGSVFGPLGTSSVDTMCRTFFSVCGDYPVGDVCQERCDSDDEDDDGVTEYYYGDDGDDGDVADNDEDDGGDGGNDDVACGGCGVNAECNGFACDCLEGFQGDPRVACVDPCDPNPCLNGGSCFLDSGGGHICSCASGYGGMACATDTSDLFGFFIEIAFDGDASIWTDERQLTFTNAANRWEEVITNQRCSIGNDDFPPGRLLILAQLEFIDGPSEVLGSASYLSVWDSCPTTSVLGLMRFDTADVEVLEASGNFDTVVLHEMGHAIGVGSLWGDCSTCRTDFDPEWKCPATVAAYNDLLGNPGGTEADIIELEGGQGTECGHFTEDIFGDEQSSGLISTDIPNVFTPLSKITAASLDDTGYVVDATGVDPYTLPSRRTGAATVVASDDGPHHVIECVAVETTVQLIGDGGDVVGETSGIQVDLYARTVA